MGTRTGIGSRALASAQAPSLRLPDLDGHEFQLSSLRGQNVLLYAWEPSRVWIDEAGLIVRPAETAPAPPQPDNSPSRLKLPLDTRDRFAEMAQEAAKIKRNAPAHHASLRDWVEHGAASRFALSPDEVVERSRRRDKSKALGHAHFQIATQLEADGHHEVAVRHFRDAHRLVSDSWTFRRQAWSLERAGEGPLARFWQGPNPAALEAWPYEGE